MSLGLVIGILLILLFIWVLITGIRNASFSQMLGSVVCIVVLVWLTKGCVPISNESYEKQIVAKIQYFQSEANQFSAGIENSFNYFESNEGLYSDEEVGEILTDMFNIRDSVESLEDAQKEIAKMKVPNDYYYAHSDLEFATKYLVMAADSISSFKATNDSEFLIRAQEHLIQYNINMTDATEGFQEVNGIDILEQK